MDPKKLSPKTPGNIVEMVSHQCITMEWSDIEEWFVLKMSEDNQKCNYEISMEKFSNFDEPWIVKYVRLGNNFILNDCAQRCSCVYKMRLRNGIVWGAYSDENIIKITKESVIVNDVHIAIIMDDDVQVVSCLFSIQVHKSYFVSCNRSMPVSWRERRLRELKYKSKCALKMNIIVFYKKYFKILNFSAIISLLTTRHIFYFVNSDLSNSGKEECDVNANRKIYNCNIFSYQGLNDNTFHVHIIPYSHIDISWLKTCDEYYNGSSSLINGDNVKVLGGSIESKKDIMPNHHYPAHSAQVVTAHLGIGIATTTMYQIHGFGAGVGVAESRY